ncbi:leucine-rich repeat protein [uncultured Bacteroides sp.]|jgi:hypothetical protein|uniref:leucine-rich repeat protein n=1 Tax=uncultured Bacteroides sp. TaxID=162156 RepID=UPI0025E708EC|nr:leucine-rich repeat protein [uncultured Bacteroides sp.]
MKILRSRRGEWPICLGKMMVASCMLSALLLTACNDNDRMEGVEPAPEGGVISLSGEIDQVAVTRVNDNGFCDGDVMGVYVVDYEGNNPGKLANHGNRATNVAHTFDEKNFKWNSAYDIYWKDNHTHVDIYGYYPIGAPTDVNAYTFELQKDQSKAAENGVLGGYEQSDFLWGKAADVAPTERVIRLPLRHRMSSARVTLKEGTGFAKDEWLKLEKQVLVMNTRRTAEINLATGEVKAMGEVAKTGTLPYRKDQDFRAIVVPQTVEGGKVLFNITVNGTAYTFKRAEAMTYLSGKMHNFTIEVNKKAESGEYEFKLAGESITAWENDDISHDATAKEYIIIDVPKAGTLKECIQAANKDYTKVMNLKLTGHINANDFYFMRNEMTKLQSLNLKEVKIEEVRNEYGNLLGEADEIPSAAMGKTLQHLVLPDKLVKINGSAFSQCTNLTGSLLIPEGVKEIGPSAFNECSALTGTLRLPSTLEKIEGSAFNECSFTCELLLPSSLTYIGDYAFSGCENIYGELHFPDKLSYLGSSAFQYCSSLTGSIIIPQTLNAIKEHTFTSCTGLNGTLQLHDGITQIERSAFSDCKFRGELILPKDLTVIESHAFLGNQFSGTLQLPPKLEVIKDYAFSGNPRLSGILCCPETLLSIGNGAFNSCSSLEGIVFAKNIENIGKYAFQNCYGIGSIVCESALPPHAFASAFNGVPKDNFTVEVPEGAITDYQTAPVWSEFKRIGAHHELICRPSIANALNTSRKQTLVLNAESDWEVESMPDWCSLSATSGTSKTELTLTINEMSKGTSGGRKGDIVFRLKDKGYTTKCAVTQHDYEYAEDEIIQLQKATHGNKGGINLVFVGDGFNAEDIANGTYLKTIKEEVEHFFGVEPYTTYRDYFNVYTAIPVSLESGIGTLNTIRYTKFETTFTGGGLKCNSNAVFDYALRMPTVTRENLKESLVVLIPNTGDYGGITEMYADGSAIAICPLSTDVYPYDKRGIIQHEAGGHGFGKLGDEYIYHNAFIDDCKCTCCPHIWEFNNAKALGWYDNLSLTGKMHEVPWSHFIFDDRYSVRVDIFEGGFMHTRGVYRSEQNSCMNNNIPYFSAISRESIVKRIKRYAGEPYSFEEFVALDKKTAAEAATRLMDRPFATGRPYVRQHAPRILPGGPQLK